MSVELRHPENRLMRTEEKILLSELLNFSLDKIENMFGSCKVRDMCDGGMGSIIFLASDNAERVLGEILAEGKYIDADGILVGIVINADQNGNIYEIDFWKVDFSPLKKYPSKGDLKNIVRKSVNNSM